MTKQRQWPYIPSVYVVAWPDADVWKVGYSGDPRRWLSFCGRSAVLVDLFEFHDEVDARAFESELRGAFAIKSRPFASAIEARPYVGSLGGWTELHILDQAWADEVRADPPKWDGGIHSNLQFHLLIVMCALDRWPHDIETYIDYDEGARYHRGPRKPLMWRPTGWVSA